MTHKRRMKATFFVIFFCLVLIASFGYIAINTNHLCCGVDCVICSELAKNAKAWHTWRIIFICIISASAFLLHAWVSFSVKCSHHFPTSLVQLKIKLSN